MLLSEQSLHSACRAQIAAEKDPNRSRGLSPPQCTTHWVYQLQKRSCYSTGCCCCCCCSLANTLTIKGRKTNLLQSVRQTALSCNFIRKRRSTNNTALRLCTANRSAAAAAVEEGQWCQSPQAQELLFITIINSCNTSSSSRMLKQMTLTGIDS